MTASTYKALYLHLPFCVRRCAYCDFDTEAVASDDPQMSVYVEQLILELRQASRNGQLSDISTIYIGGGTPSYLGHKLLISLVYAISTSLQLHPDSEFTVEANPESLAEPMVKDLYALGVNRLSLGVQSFNDQELQILGRSHTAQRAKDAITIAANRFENLSLDLICAIPGQSLASWQESLQRAVSCGPTHISVYPLTVEEGTPLASAVLSGQLVVPDEDIQAEMMLAAADYLTSQGFARYEVASYAQPGCQCQHNIAYWTGQSYLGLGRGAAGMLNLADGSRQRFLGGQLVEQLSAREAIAEDLMLGMRMSAGVAAPADKQALQVLDSLVADGLARLNAGRYQPTESGWLLGNELFSRIWNTLRNNAGNRGCCDIL
ncbi:MAG: radical SAM family heme chaperone HemW [Coriobacteriales bacterium]|jgi:oxygen-independent coproporphyrinogen-3 oxidase|nr:radical SAM family heme chaperone HemW [Coriobacteriales bacterium]